MSSKEQTLVACGDILIECDSDAETISKMWDGVRDEIQDATVALGHGELPFSERGYKTYVDMFVGAPKACPPHNVKTIKEAGFDALTLCTNHIFDLGPDPIEDTIALCEENELAHTGAGMNLEEASEPAIVEKDGVKYGFLAYNCTGPIGSWAKPDKAGCNYVHSVAHYVNELPTIGGPTPCYSFPMPQDVERMQKQIADLRDKVDVLAVSLHKGVGFVPAYVGMHESTIAKAAIDAGADVIFGHHGHMLKGIEVYKGKVIFHDMGNLQALADLPDGTPFFRYGTLKVQRVRGDLTEEQKISRQREFDRRVGAPFVWGANGTACEVPPMDQMYHSMLGKVYVEDGKVTKVNFVPLRFHDEGAPYVLKREDPEAQQLFEYMQNITENAWFDTQFEWDGDEIHVITE